MANTAQCHLYTINNPRKALLHSKISSYNCRVVIITGPLVLPQDRRYAWHIFQALDIAKIEQATDGSKYYWNARSYWIGEKTVEEIENTFYQRDTRSVERSAPAHGLRLARIEYSRESAFSMIDRSLGFQMES
ncbi:hypothetical protein ACTFIW_005454 [Dictyostelium discoideum]